MSGREADHTPELTFHDMVLAYRKVKSEIWWMKSIPSLRQLTEYEERLETNLESLKKRILNGFPKGFSDDFLGEVVYLPKKLKERESQNSPKVTNPETIHFTELSDSKASKERKAARWGEPEMRMMAIPSIDFQILGVLWTMRDGGDWDAARSTACRANILRRQHIPDAESQFPETEASLRGPINKRYPGVFKPYFHAYKSWRNDGLKKANDAVEDGQRVFALTLDLQKYYHQIDACCPRTMRPPQYGDKVTETFYQALEAWQNRHGERPENNGESKPEKLGIPVGLIASAAVANVILQPLDAAIEKQLSPIYYGRYVDDLFLVLSLNGDFTNGESIIDELKNLMASGTNGEPRLGRDETTNTLSFDCQEIWGKSVFTCKAEKQRLFLLEGQPGKDLLKVIDSDLREHSSEWRMVPELDQKEDCWLKETLVASQNAAEEATTLRRADDLSIRRLGVAVALRKLQAIERFGLKESEWRKQRSAFYDVAATHIFTPEGLCDFWPKLPALFGLIFANGDWAAANRFLTQLIEVIGIYGDLSDKPENSCLSHWLGKMLPDELMRSCTKPPTTKEALRFFERFERKVGSLLSGIGNLEDRIREFQKRDLDRIGFRAAARNREQLIDRVKKLGVSDILKAIDQAENFLKNKPSASLDPKYFWLLFPTRPLGELEISFQHTEASLKTKEMRRCLFAVRGQELKEKPDELEESDQKVNEDDSSSKPSRKPPETLSYEAVFTGDSVKVAIANFETKDRSWTDRVRGKADLCRDRLSRILDLVGDFQRAIKQHSWQEKPLYFVMPELSVPGEWLAEISGYFAQDGVSLIVGGEYEQGDSKTKLINPAYLFLRHKNLGYPSTWAIRQIKTQAAPAEALGLWQENEIQLSTQAVQDLPVYKHGYFRFGVIICSELMDAEVQYHFRGHVDALFCLEWNRDIDTFDGLVRAAAHTVHCFFIQVNNREFGDSRIRAPGKESYQRDIARLHGGIHNSFVVGELPIEKLRDFQRKKHSDLDDNAPYKPLPSGYAPRSCPRLFEKQEDGKENDN